MDHIARAADALAAAYLEVIELPADTLGLIFAVFDQGDYPYDFVQPPVAIPGAKLAWCAEHGRLGASYRGRGLVWGLEFADPARASEVCARAFELGLLLETSGPQSEVVKLLPPLTITPEELDEGLRTLARAVAATRA